MKVTDYTNTKGTLRVLLYGLTGSGKSTLAATLARKFRLIWIDTENSVEILSKLPVEYQANIELIKIPDTAAFPMAAQTIQKLFKVLKASICDEHGTIDCPRCKADNKPLTYVDFTTLDPRKDIVVVDSMTQFGASLMAHDMKSLAINAKPERDNWGCLRKNTEYFGSNVQGASFNLVVTSLCTESQLEDGSTRLVPAFGSRDQSSNIGAKFSAIVYCTTKNKQHVAYSSSTASNQFLAKSRVDYVIETQQGSPDLVGMFESYFESCEKAANSSSSSTVLPNAIAPATTIQAKPISPGMVAMKKLSESVKS